MIKKGLTANGLKLIAIIAMTIEHLTYVISPYYPMSIYIQIFHIIGKLTAPIMWFFIVEGYCRTNNYKKYLTRLVILAIVSHFAYIFAFNITPFKYSIFNQTSIILSLICGLLSLKIWDSKIGSIYKVLLILLLCAISLVADWGIVSVIIILEMYVYKNAFNKKMLLMLFWIIIYTIFSYYFIENQYAYLNLFVIISIPLLKLYNGKKGVFDTKFFFYSYYPLHLILCGIIRVFLNH